MHTVLITMNPALRAFRPRAETCFFKPVTEFNRLIEALESAFDRQDRWKQVLKELCDRRKNEAFGLSA
jgi:hypothetical protein